MGKNDYFYQYVGFHFSVVFSGLGQDDKGVDARFQSVSGLNAQLETETIKEGGENRFEHVLPVRTKFPDLVLKRGLMKPDDVSEVTKWCNNAFEKYALEKKIPLGSPDKLPVRPINLEVKLLNENHDPLVVWNIVHAWPKAWKFGELNAERGEVLIETIELNYNYFTYRKGS